MHTSYNMSVLYMKFIYIYTIIILFIEGRKHDAGMLGKSGLLENLERVAHSPNNEPLCLHGDPAYPLRNHLQAPFRNVVLTKGNGRI